jgi:hypothetical protein
LLPDEVVMKSLSDSTGASLDLYQATGSKAYDNDNSGSGYQNLLAVKSTARTSLKKRTLTLSKAVAGDINDLNQEFTFTIKLTNSSGAKQSYWVISNNAISVAEDSATGVINVTLKSGQQVTIGLPDTNYNYEITETNIPTYYTASYVIDSGATPTESNIATGSVNTSGADTKVTFTNTHQYPTSATFTLEKKVELGVGATEMVNKTYSFTVNFTNPGNAYTVAGGTLNTDGSVTADLKNGDKLTVTGLQFGYDYTVTENVSSSDASQYTVGASIDGTEATVTATSLADGSKTFGVGETNVGSGTDPVTDVIYTNKKTAKTKSTESNQGSEESGSDNSSEITSENTVTPDMAEASDSTEAAEETPGAPKTGDLRLTYYILFVVIVMDVTSIVLMLI